VRNRKAKVEDRLVNQVRSAEAKLQRVFDRAEKVMDEIMKSKLDSQDKLDLFVAYRDYWADSQYALAKKYPYLKAEHL